MEYPQFNRTYYIFKWPVFHCYVSLLECTSFFAMTFRICWMLLATTVFFFNEKVATGDNEPHATLRRTLSVGMALSLQAARVFPVKLHNIWAENRRIPWRFVPGSSHHVAASPRRSRHFMKARVPREIFTTVGGLGTPHPAHISICCFSPAAVVDASESISDIIWFVQFKKKLIPNTFLKSQMFQDMFRIV